MFQFEDENYWHIKMSNVAIKSSENEGIEQENEQSRHDAANIFILVCKCSSCNKFKKLVTLLLADEILYSDQWRELSEIIILKHYGFVSKNATILKKYKEYVEKTNFQWYADGKLDVKKTIQLSAGPNISPTFSVDMKSLVIFDILSSRDKQQLFELMCLQMRCIGLACKDYLEENVKIDFSDNNTVLKFFEEILNAYNCFRMAGIEFARLFHDFEKTHLEKFSVTWSTINEWVFYECVYSKYENFIPECIIKLKQNSDMNTYKQNALKLINLDENMTEVCKDIRKKTISAITSFKSSTEESQRRTRIKQVQNFFANINKSDISIELSVKKPVLDWIISKDDECAWENVLHNIKNRNSCNYLEQIEHVIQDCCCRQCIIFGTGNDMEIGEKSNEEEQTMDSENEFKKDLYHLSWALFKHLKDRKVYEIKSIQPEIFCTFQKESCQLKQCSVAASILIGGYPVQFTKYLLKCYTPLEDTERERIRKSVGDDSEEHFDAMKSMKWDPKSRIHISLSSVLAECYGVSAKFPSSKILISYFKSLFNTKLEDDISLDSHWLEQIIKSTLLKKFLLRSIKYSWNENGDDKAIDEIENKMKFLSLTCEDGGLAITEKPEVLDTLDKNIEYLNKNSKFSLFGGVAEDMDVEEVFLRDNTPTKPKETKAEMKKSDEASNQKTSHNTKKVSESKCDHNNETVQNHQECVCHYCNLFEKENSNSRNYEMRTRLRKRLQQQQNRKNLKLNLPNTPKEAGQSKNSQTSSTSKQSNEQNTRTDKTTKFNRNKEKSIKSDVIKETEHNVKPIENLIEYIEGVEEKKVVKTKAKPKKPKKNTALLEEKKLTELESLNGNLMNCEVQIKQYLNQLMQIRRGKQKDPTRIKTAEDKLKEFTDLKSKYETEATQTIKQLKQINVNFDITTHKEWKYVLTSFKNSAVKEQHKPSAPVNEVKSEADKRMVTIRRINLPYSQPQVTVTAKGNTPDQDQLLYAFVNGHLVPGAMISSNKKTNSTQNIPSNQQQQQQQQQQKTQPNTARQTESKQKAPEPSSNLNNKKNNQNTKDKDKDVKKKDATQKNKKKQVEETVTPPPVAPKNLKNNKPVAKNKEEAPIAKNSKKNVKTSSESDKNSTKDVPSANDSSRSNNYIDPEFDNNAFKLLIMDDSDEESHTVSTASKSSKNKEISNSKKNVTTKNDKKSKTASNNNNTGDKTKPVKIVDLNANNNKANKKKSNGKSSKSVMEEPTANKIIEDVSNRNGSKKMPKMPQNVSIADQLNKGIQVEGLRLPPGITLTKVDYSSMENLRAKQNSINNITIPIEEYNRNLRETTMRNSVRDPFITQVAPFTEPASNNKKNKKKKKKKKNGINEDQAEEKSNIVTLKNPMFNQSYPDVSNGNGMMFDSSGFNAPPPPQRVDQPASIIRNENGMYTIRNPAFQNAFLRLNKDANAEMPPPNERDTPMGNKMRNNNPNSLYMSQNSMPKEDPFSFNCNDNSNNCGPYDYGKNKCYDDLSFLETLQPGQHLNSEVTIHNISESKFFKRPEQGQQQQQQQQRMDTNNYYCQKRPDEEMCRTTSQNFNHRNVSDNVFVPNQMINLSELESEEREIESFKRFDYFFKPPKDKPKININMKDIVLSKKPVTTSSYTDSSKMDE